MDKQIEINNDLKHYIHEKKKAEPFWKKVFNLKSRSKEAVQEDIKEDLEKKAAVENAQISKEDQKEFQEMESKIEEVNKVEEEVMEKIEVEHESLLRKFFKKLNFSKKSKADILDEEEIEEFAQTHEKKKDELITKVEISELDDDEVKEFLKKTHDWLLELPPERLAEIKETKEFDTYKKLLKKHNLIK